MSKIKNKMNIKEYCLNNVVLIHSILLCIAVVLSAVLVFLHVLGIIPSWVLLFLIPIWCGYGLSVEFIGIWTNDKLSCLIMNSVDLDEVDLNDK